MGRSYKQYCPLGYALDILGERWTILILREMIFGPRRFTDLLEVLPGMSGSTLAARLRKLEKLGFVEHEWLPAPMGGLAYRLGKMGHIFAYPLKQLAHDGIRLLEWPPPEGYMISPMSVIFQMRQLFRPTSANENLEITAHIQLSERLYFQSKVSGSFLYFSTLLLGEPDFWVRTPPVIWIEILTRRLALEEAIEQEKITILQGHPVRIAQFLEDFEPLEIHND